MRRLVSLLRTRAFPVTAIGVYFLIRMTASAGHTAGHFPDSQSYQSLTFIGANERFWAVPLFYSVFTSDSARVLLQVAIGTFAWASLAVTLGKNRRFGRLVLTGTLILGLSPQVIRYDLAILSESLGISFAVLAVTATVLLTETQSVLIRLGWCVSVVLLVFTRPTHLVVLVILLLLSIAGISKSRGTRKIPMAIALCCLLAWGLTQLHGNKPYSTLNFYTVLMDRVIVDNSRYEWFVNHGMPDVPGVRESFGYDFQGALDPQLQKVVQLPDGQQPPKIIRTGGIPLATWVVDHGWRTYGKYIATHLSDSINRVSQLSGPTLSPANDDFLPLQNGAMQSRSFFMPWKIWTLVGLISLAISALKPAHKKRLYYLVGMAITTVVLFCATMLTAGIEHQRHAVTVAVLVRVLALAALTSSLPLASQREKPDSLSSAPAS